MNMKTTRTLHPEPPAVAALLALAALCAAPAALAATASATATALSDSRDYTLSVVSPHGNPTPSNGTHAYAWHATVSASIEPESAGHTCLGWTGTGSVPETGDTNTTGDILLTEPDSSITWLWKPQEGTTDTYLVIDLSDGPDADSYPVGFYDDLPAGGWTDEYRTTKLVMRRIPAGTFTMGSPEGELGRAAAREALREVTLTKAFYMGVFPVTQKQWERVMGGWPSYFDNTDHRDARPLESRSWNDIRGGVWPGSPAGSGTPASGTFVERISTRTGLTFDLPTEAQWERAGRAGTGMALNSGRNLTSTENCPNMAETGRYWYNGGSGYVQGGNTSVGTATVGSYPPNAWGLHDIHGNVWEWCLDWFAETATGTVDPVGAASGPDRAVRGGSWAGSAWHCRSASRNGNHPDNRHIGRGFRLARTLQPEATGYTLTVVDGSGGGAYAAGTEVAIAAHAAPAGQVFSHWTAEPTNADLGASFDAEAHSTTLTMPAHDVTLTANHVSQVGPPQVTTAAATGLTTTGATLHGTVNPNGATTTAQFEYGLTTDYGSTATVTLSPTDGTTAQAVSAVVSGLESGQTYHYRLTATNNSGASAGADRTLVTDRAEVAAPTFNPAGGAHAVSSVSVTVSCATEGAITHYTLDGSEPTEASPTITTGATVTVPVPGTLKARAFKTTWHPSAVTSAVFNSSQGGEAGDYLVIDLSAGPSASSYPVSYYSDLPSGGWTDEYKTTKLVLRRIPAGTFTMGSPEDELGRSSDEVQREVTLTKDYYMGVFQVTQRQWERVMGHWPSYFKGDASRDSRPLEQRPWNTIRGGVWPGEPAGSGQPAAGTFIERINARTGLTFDLPTEAQWERACRAGTATALNSGKNITTADLNTPCPHVAEVCRYRNNHPGGYSSSTSVSTDGGTAKVGSYLPNAWGLYDMHGNVWESCLDWYTTTPPGSVDPVGAASGLVRVIRGGSWNAGAGSCRSAARSNSNPDSPVSSWGFRLSRTLQPEATEYTLTVVDGSGGGAYAAGTEVDIAAHAAPAGQVFSHWTAEPTDADLGASFDPEAQGTTPTMPAHDVTLTANYTEAPNHPPHTPTPTSPADGAAGASLTPTLQASPYSDPDGDGHADSQWQVAGNSSFSSPEWDSAELDAPGTSTTVPAGLLTNNTTYFWRVRYKDDRGAWSAWSTPEWTFTTEEDTTPPTVTITSPTSATTWTSDNALMNLGGTAADDAGVTSVTLVNDRDSMVRNATGTDSWHYHDLPLFDGRNIITVTAHDAAGNAGTDTITVTHRAPMTPAGAEELESRHPTFTWPAEPGASWYEIELQRNGAAYDSRWVEKATTWTPHWDMPGDAYRWRVRAWGEDVGMGAWSDWADFSIRVRRPAVAPTPQAPSGNVNTTRRPAFSWSSVEDATWYRLYVSRDGQQVLDRWVEGVTDFTPTADLALGSYQWWVVGWGLDGLGPWSAAAAFEALPVIPGAIVQLAPEGMRRSRDVGFRWIEDARANRYHVWVGRADGSTYRNEWIGRTGETIGRMALQQMPAENYRWWIRGEGADGLGPWSGPMLFTAGGVLPHDWLLRHYGSLDNVPDQSLKGHSLQHEYIAVTDPNDVRSVFRIEQAGIGTDTLTLGLHTHAGRQYSVEQAGDLDAADWQVLTTLAGDGSFRSVHVPRTDPAGFYRVRVELEE